MLDIVRVEMVMIYRDNSVTPAVPRSARTAVMLNLLPDEKAREAAMLQAYRVMVGTEQPAQGVSPVEQVK